VISKRHAINSKRAKRKGCMISSLAQSSVASRYYFPAAGCAEGSTEQLPTEIPILLFSCTIKRHREEYVAQEKAVEQDLLQRKGLPIVIAVEKGRCEVGAQGGFKASQTAKARLGLPCAVTATRDMAAVV